MRQPIRYIVLFLGLLASCSKTYVEQSPLESHAEQNLKMIVLLKTGDKVKKVEKMLGPPDKMEHIFVNGTGSVEFYFYRTGATMKRVEDDYTPLVFKDGKLVAWGWPFYRMLKIAENPTNSVISKLQIEHTTE